MPELDAELKKKGMKAMIPRVVFNAAHQRKPGYLEAFMERATLSKGAFYLTPEDYEYIHNEYGLTDEVLAQRRAKEQAVQRALEEARKNPTHRLIQQFWDLKQDCPHPKLAKLRKAYRAEIEAREATGCTACQLTPIKKKYKTIIEQKYGNIIN